MTVFEFERHLCGLKTKMNPDALTSGGVDCFAMHFAQDPGVYLIENGREISENPGIENFAKKLSGALNGMKISYFENKPPCMIK